MGTMWEGAEKTGEHTRRRTDTQEDKLRSKQNSLWIS